MLLRWSKNNIRPPIEELPDFSHMNSPPHTWFPLEEVLCLDGCDLWHGGEDMGTVGSCSLQTVAVVDLSIACFLIHVELNGRETGKRVQWRNCFIIKYFHAFFLNHLSDLCIYKVNLTFNDLLLVLCLIQHTYICKLVIEVHISSTQVSSQQCGMSSEDGCNR